MEKTRRTKILSILFLLVGILVLSVGFAAFSNTLIISSSANVKPDSSTFSVLFSSSGTSQLTNAVSGVGTGNSTGGNATINGTTISGLKANFTEPGQTVTYSFYVHNVGSYVAHLEKIDFGTGKSCSAAAATTTDSLVQDACDDITVSVSVGDNNYTKNSKVYEHSLAIDAYEPVVVTIDYSSSGDRADGEFNISFGDISLIYSSVYTAAPEIISFSIMGTAHQAEAGMTWGEWLVSDYNNQGMAKESGDDVCTMVDMYIGKKDDVIVSGKSYPSSIVWCS